MAQALVGAVEVQVMASGDRSTETRAKLIAVEQTLGSTIAIIRPVVGVQGRVPHVVVDRAVVGLATALRHQRDHARTGALILGIIDVLHHLLLLY